MKGASVMRLDKIFNNNSKKRWRPSEGAFGVALASDPMVRLSQNFSDVMGRVTIRVTTCRVEIL